MGGGGEGGGFHCFNRQYRSISSIVSVAEAKSNSIRMVKRRISEELRMEMNYIRSRSLAKQGY